MPATSRREQERAERGERIVAASDGGATAGDIADAEGCAVRTVRRVLAAARERGATMDEMPAPARIAIGDAVAFEVSPNRELIESVELHRWAIEQMRTVARRTRSDALRIGAVKTAAQLSRARLGMLASVGVVPLTRSDWSSEASYRLLYAVLADEAREAGLDPATAFAKARRIWEENMLGHPIRVADDEAVAA